MLLYFLRPPIASELEDSNELDVLDLHSSLRLRFSNQKLASPNNNELSKSASQIFKNFASLQFFIKMQLPYTQILLSKL